MVSGPGFAAIVEHDIGEIAALLRRVFQTDSSWVPFQPAVLHWKALAPHPLWPGSRGYRIRNQDRIVAFGCAMPCRFLAPDRSILGTCIIDWAADGGVPGAGVLIFREMEELVEALFGFGGSSTTQALLPRIGFETQQQILTFEKVTKPLSAFLGKPGRSLRDYLRFARNIIRRVTHGTMSNPGWTAKEVESFGPEVVPVLPRPGVVPEFVCYRDPSLLNYYLASPAAAMTGVLIHKGNNLSGYAVLARIGRDVRIAELWVDSPQHEDWTAALHTVCKLAASYRPARVVFGCTGDVPRRAAQRSGFHLSGSQPVFLKHEPPFLMNAGLLETDFFYLPGI